MSIATKAVPAWVAEPPKAFFIRKVIETIRECRETKRLTTLDYSCARAHGMISAGLFLGCLTNDDYDRLWDLASNANQYRYRELRLGTSLHTWKPAATAVQEASA